jgi:hypothetical protein
MVYVSIFSINRFQLVSKFDSLSVEPAILLIAFQSFIEIQKCNELYSLNMRDGVRVTCVKSELMMAMWVSERGTECRELFNTGETLIIILSSSAASPLSCYRGEMSFRSSSKSRNRRILIQSCELH